MEAEAQLLAHLRALRRRPARQRAECLSVLRAYEPIARKARWAYGHFLRRTGREAAAPESFVEDYLKSWCESVLYLANGPGRSLSVTFPPRLERSLILLWHFPEHTALIDIALEHNMLVLVASDEGWQAGLRREGCLYNFRTPKMSSVLPRAFKQGRPVVAMIDYCYEATRHIMTDFLSYPSKLPVGVFQLAERYGYDTYFYSPRGRRLQPVDTVPAGSRTVEESAEHVNRLVEREILRRPPRWLLWPSVDSRWIGVDYDA